MVTSFGTDGPESHARKWTTREKWWMIEQPDQRTRWMRYVSMDREQSGAAYPGSKRRTRLYRVARRQGRCARLAFAGHRSKLSWCARRTARWRPFRSETTCIGQSIPRQRNYYVSFDDNCATDYGTNVSESERDGTRWQLGGRWGPRLRVTSATELGGPLACSVRQHVRVLQQQLHLDTSHVFRVSTELEPEPLKYRQGLRRAWVTHAGGVQPYQTATPSSFRSGQKDRGARLELERGANVDPGRHPRTGGRPTGPAALD
jgi:hypothetical protein